MIVFKVQDMHPTDFTFVIANLFRGKFDPQISVTAFYYDRESQLIKTQARGY